MFFKINYFQILHVDDHAVILTNPLPRIAQLHCIAVTAEILFSKVVKRNNTVSKYTMSQKKTVPVLFCE